MSCEDQLTPEEITKENTTLLIPEFDYPEESQQYVKKNYRNIFDFELFAWCRDKNFWPKKRTYEMFLEWFDIQINSEVFDLVDEQIEKQQL